MSIDVTGNTVNFGTYTISATPTSIIINGKLRAAGCGFAPNHAQGSISGYSSGGLPAPGTFVDTIEKFPFTSDTNASDVGEITLARSTVAGSSSDISGYASGGTFAPQPPFKQTNIIDKFPFTSDTSASDVGDLVQARWQVVGQSSSVCGYVSGGFISTNPAVDTIEKFPFSSDTNATNVGELSLLTRLGASHSSVTNGYTAGGLVPGVGTVTTDTIDKFPFAADAPGTDIGNLTQTRFIGSNGQPSSSSGYTAGGGQPAAPGAPPPVTNTIDKFPFAADANATDVGELTQSRRSTTGTSSTVNGYSAGGLTAPTTTVDTIDKFPFSADSSASDVGELTQARSSMAGQQV